MNLGSTYLGLDREQRRDYWRYELRKAFGARNRVAAHRTSHVEYARYCVARLRRLA